MRMMPNFINEETETQSGFLKSACFHINISTQLVVLEMLVALAALGKWIQILLETKRPSITNNKH